MEHDYSKLIKAAQKRDVGPIDPFTIGYVTRGGTYVMASAPRWNDDDEAHDLVAILPLALENWTHVIPLRPTVNLGLIKALRAALDA